MLIWKENVILEEHKLFLMIIYYHMLLYRSQVYTGMLQGYIGLNILATVTHYLFEEIRITNIRSLLGT
jgi:hypothetical protein